MTIKEQLLQEIDSTPDTIFAETLDFLRFLKTKQKKSETQSALTDSEDTATTTQTDLENKSTDAEQSYRPTSGRSILRHLGKWEGDDERRMS